MFTLHPSIPVFAALFAWAYTIFGVLWLPAFYASAAAIATLPVFMAKVDAQRALLGLVLVLCWTHSWFYTGIIGAASIWWLTTQPTENPDRQQPSTSDGEVIGPTPKMPGSWPEEEIETPPATDSDSSADIEEDDGFGELPAYMCTSEYHAEVVVHSARFFEEHQNAMARKQASASVPLHEVDRDGHVWSPIPQWILDEAVAEATFEIAALVAKQREEKRTRLLLKAFRNPAVQL